MFINAVIDHNHIWDLGIQLDRYTRIIHDLTPTNIKRLKYFPSCPFDEHHENWLKSKEVDIENIMTRCKVKPCKEASFLDPREFWYHCVGKSMVGCNLHYALCRIIEYGFPMHTSGRKRNRHLDTHFINAFKKKTKLCNKVSNVCRLC